MKLLFINVQHKNQTAETGGSFVNKTNCNILRSIYGEENFKVYDMFYYESPFQTLRNTAFGRAGGYKKGELQKILNIVEQNSIDIVFIGFANVGTLARDLKKKRKNIKVITFCQNNEYKFLKQSIRKYSLLLKIAYSINVYATHKSEKNACKYSDLLITINNRDSEDFLYYYGRKADFCLPITFEDDFKANRVLSKSDNDEFLLFVGSNFFGNTEGLFWFIENCMPKISKKLIVVGSGMDVYKDKYPTYNVEFLGFVEDLSEYYYRAFAVVLPIISGSGMKTKTCEALMYGKTIFGTKEAFEGYELDYDKVGKLCNTREDFIETINSSKKSYINNYSRAVFLTKYEKNVVKEQFKKKLMGKELL